MHQPLPPINLNTTAHTHVTGVIHVARGHLVTTTTTTTTTSRRPWALSMNRLASASPASMELEVTNRNCTSVIRNDNDITEICWI